MESKIKAVLFDVDDTLYDRNKAQYEVAKLLFQHNPALFAGFSFAAVETAFIASDRLADEKYMPITDIKAYRLGRFEIFLQRLGIQTDYRRELVDAYISLYPTVSAPVTDLHHLLGRLKMKYQLGIVSNGFSDIQHRKLDNMGIVPYFDSIVVSGATEIEKPDPRIFLKTCEEMGRRPDECIYVGDSYERDVIGAKNAAMKACWYNPGRKPVKGNVVSDWEIHTLEEIFDLF